MLALVSLSEAILGLFAGPSCVSQIDVLCVAHCARPGFPKGANRDWLLLLKAIEWALLGHILCAAAATGGIAAAVRVDFALLSWGKTNRDIGQDGVFLTLREGGRAKGKW